MVVKRADTMAVDGKNHEVYDHNRFERDIALVAWKMRWTGLSLWCVCILVEFVLLTCRLFSVGKCNPTIAGSETLFWQI